MTDQTKKLEQSIQDVNRTNSDLQKVLSGNKSVKLLDGTTALSLDQRIDGRYVVGGKIYAKPQDGVSFADGVKNGELFYVASQSDDSVVEIWWNDRGTPRSKNKSFPSLGRLNQAVTDIDDSAERAELAANLAASAGNLYANTADGIIATKNGEYFSVISSDDKSVSKLYKNQNGVAVYQNKESPSINILDGNGAKYRNGVLYGVGDRVKLDNGNIVRSLISKNPNNPNLNMTGWVKVNSTTQIYSESGFSQNEINKRTVDIRDFGAKVDGVTDDTAAIQSAINSLILTGGIVNFPVGTAIVSVQSNGRALYAYSNITLLGQGCKSILKIKDKQGDWQQLLSSESNGAYVENVLIKNLFFDGNSINNPSAVVINGQSNTSQYLISFRNFKNVKVESCGFKGGGVNSVILGSYTEKSNIGAIRDCDFYFETSATQPAFDSTMLYTNSGNILVSQNRFHGTYNSKLTTAFELHGGPAIAINNETFGVRVGCHLTADSDTYAVPGRQNDFILSGNRFNDCSIGCTLWAITDGLRGVKIFSNQITIDHSLYAETGYDLGIALRRDTDQTGSFEDIEIFSNTIVMRNQTYTTSGESRTKSAAIGLNHYYNVTNVKVYNNTVIGSGCKGVTVGDATFAASGYKHKDIYIYNNYFQDVGTNTLVDNQTHRCVMFASGAIENVNFKDNLIVDTASNFSGMYWLFNNSAPSDLKVSGNTLKTKQGAYMLPYPTSQIIDSFRNTHYTVNANGIPPNSTLLAGDAIYYTGDLNTSGTVYQWVCSGTGTSKAISTTVTTTTSQLLGAYSATVADSSVLKYGDVVSISGLTGKWRIGYISGNNIRLIPMSAQSMTVVTGAAMTNAAITVKPIATIS